MKMLNKKRPSNIRTTRISENQVEEAKEDLELESKEQQQYQHQQSSKKSKNDQPIVSKSSNVPTEKDTTAKSLNKPLAGPVRSVNRRPHFTARFDYARDLCKDYNETGFCGFGDSCKFLHDRGDYKSGWELDLEWEKKQQCRMVAEEKSINPEQTELNNNVAKKPQEPTECGLCQRPFNPPIMETKCGHCFCETCALTHSRSSKKCATCGTNVDGQFKVVRKNPHIQ